MIKAVIGIAFVTAISVFGIMTIIDEAKHIRRDVAAGAIAFVLTALLIFMALRSSK